MSQQKSFLLNRGNFCALFIPPGVSIIDNIDLKKKTQQS